MRRHLAPLGGVVGVLLGAMLAWPFTVDDAYIVARYARHLVFDSSYAMNAGGTPSDGVTGPLWLVPALLGHACVGDPVTMAKGVGVLCGLLAAGIALAALRARCGGRVAAAWAALVLVLQPSYWTWLGAGLETGAAALSVAQVGFGRRAWLGSVSCGLLAWLRPEMVPAALWLWFARFGVRASPVCGLPAAVLAIAVVSFRLLCFGSVLPLSVAAKPATLSNGGEYVLRGLLLTTGLVGFALVCWVGVRRERRLFYGWIIGLAGIALGGGDWMPGFRLFAPLSPIHAVLLGLGLQRVALRAPRWSCVLGLLACLVPALDAVVRVPALWHSAQARLEVARPLALSAREYGGTLALVDVGYIGWVSGLPVMDLGGITDADIGRLPGGHLDKHLSQELLTAKQPVQAILHSQRAPRVDQAGRLLGFFGYPVEHRFAKLANVQRNYRVRRIFRYGPDYYYIWLVRVD